MGGVLPLSVSSLPVMTSEQDGTPGLEFLWALDADSMEIVSTVFRPGFLVALFAFGWAVNVAIFSRFRIDYCAVLGVSKEEAIRPHTLGVMAISAAISLGFLRFSLMSTGSVSAIVRVVLLTYTACLAGLFVKLPAALDRRMRWRVPLARALWRSVCPESGREIPFVEVLVADGLTSMAKVFFDLAVSTCVVTHEIFAGLPARTGLDAVVLNTTAGSKPLAIDRPGLWGEALKECRQSGLPFFVLAIPFLIRARQCVITSRNAPDSLARDMQRVNLLKYLTALPVIVLSFCYAHSQELSSIFQQDDFEFMWALAAVINSGFSFLWDLVMDWGLLQAGAEPFGLRHVLLFRGACCLYYVLIFVNLIGRSLWSLRWFPQATLLLGTFFLGTLTQAAEVTRRCLWNVVRVEWECIKKNVHRVDKQFPV